MKFVFVVLATLLPAVAYSIGEAGDTDWAKGASVEVQLRLSATVGTNGQVKVSGDLLIKNPSDTNLTIQNPRNRPVLAFLVFDPLGNPVAPAGRGKADLPDGRLTETIPGFHDTRKRFASLQQAIQQDDFGDMVRTTTSPTLEDEKDLSKVRMHMPIFKQLAEGYLSTAGSFLTRAEKALLAFSGKLITFEIGIRFLTDFLSGDTYFRIHRPEHNLDRCRTQFKLVQSIEQQEEAMQKFINGLDEAAARGARLVARSAKRKT